MWFRVGGRGHWRSWRFFSRLHLVLFCHLSVVHKSCLPRHLTRCYCDLSTVILKLSPPKKDTRKYSQVRWRHTRVTSRAAFCFCAHSFDGIGMNKHCFIFEMCMHIDVREYCVWTYCGVRSRQHFSAYFAWANCNNSRWFSHLPSVHLAGNSVFSLSLLHQHVHALLGSPYTSLVFCPPKY